MTGLIDWGNVMFTHPEYDVAISHMIMSIGPLYLDGNLPLRDDLRAAVEWAMAEYLAAYEAQRPIDDGPLSSITVRCVRHMPTRKLSLPGRMSTFRTQSTMATHGNTRYFSQWSEICLKKRPG